MRQPAIDRGELPTALLCEFDGDDMACHNEAMCRIKHHRDLPQKSPGACLRLTRDARLRCTGRLLAAFFFLFARPPYHGLPVLRSSFVLSGFFVGGHLTDRMIRDVSSKEQDTGWRPFLTVLLQ
ncbi:MAG: hypothetical protein ACLUI3_05035 [Christensenellales bacterium]